MNSQNIEIGSVVDGCVIINESASPNGRICGLVCRCGKMFSRRKAAIRYTLKMGGRLSCGCLVGKAGTHRLSSHPLYSRHSAMLRRCNNQEDASYPSYGGKGVCVCEEWSLPDGEGFRNFLRDMGECPEGYEIDRIDVNKGYTKENCRWATRKLQANNKRPNKLGLRGVRYIDNKYEVRFGSRYYGRVDSIFEAACIRKRLEAELQETDALPQTRKEQ
jgi:hypothetical protein